MAQSKIPAWGRWQEFHVPRGDRDAILIATNGEAETKNADAVSRCSVEMTEEDRRRMVNQGLSPDECTDDVSIVMARVRLDRRKEMVETMMSSESGELSREHVLRRLERRLKETTKPGVVIYYIGYGKRSTGDWCFKDGFITFRDIAELYSHVFHHRALTIITDCSHSGAWVDACLEYLDEQGVRPCGHSAKEKGILLKVYASCEPAEIAATNCFFVKAAVNDKNTGEMAYSVDEQLRESQHSCVVNTTKVRCGKDIEEDCALRTGYTWKSWQTEQRIFLVNNEYRGWPIWQYVLIRDNRVILRAFEKAAEKGRLRILAHYGQVLKSGWGKEPPNEVKDEIDTTYCKAYS